MIKAKDVDAEKAQREGVRRVSDWLEGLLPDDEKEEDDGGSAESGKETSVIVNQLACKEAGCPDVEVVITLLRAKPRPKLMFKIYKAAANLTSDEVESAMKKALADEQGKDESNDHSHADTGIGDDCDCCEDHGPDQGRHEGESNKQQKKHEHDHEQ